MNVILLENLAGAAAENSVAKTGEAVIVKRGQAKKTACQGEGGIALQLLSQSRIAIQRSVENEATKRQPLLLECFGYL